MKLENKELVDAFNAFLTLDELFAFDGALCDITDVTEKMARITEAEKTINEIAQNKNLTVEQLFEKVKDIVEKVTTE